MVKASDKTALFVVSAVFFASLFAAGNSTAEPNWLVRREVLPQRLTEGVFRIHYTVQGDDAFPDQSAVDKLASQLQRADRFYSDILGLTPPLKNKKYRGLGAIDVHLLRMDDSTGTAGDAPIAYNYVAFRDPTPALSISISTKWKPGNLTPEHELFHSYQYGYTFFKNPWYLEGMARILENVFRNRRFVTEPLPSTQQELAALQARSYGAAPFWGRLMQLCNPACSFTDQAATAFEPKNAAVCDGGLIKAVLEEFQHQDAQASQARHLNPQNWPEVEQRSAVNNPWLLAGLMRALERQCPIETDAELHQFHQLIKNATPPLLRQ